MLLRVLDSRIGHAAANRRVGVATGGVGPVAFPQLALALTQGQVWHGFGRHGFGRVFPTQASDAKWLACPAVAHGVIEQVALFGFCRDLTYKRARLIDGEA